MTSIMASRSKVTLPIAPPTMALIGVPDPWFTPFGITVAEACIADIVVLELGAAGELADALEVEYMAPAMVDTWPLLSSTLPRASSSVHFPASQQAVLLKMQRKDSSGQEVRGARHRRSLDLVCQYVGVLSSEVLT